MKEHPIGDRHLLKAAVLAAVICLAGLAIADDDYVLDDAQISGREIHVFNDAGESVSLVLGGFKLTIGRRVLSGRDAVVWVRQQNGGKEISRDMEVYIEGDAQVVEPGGATTTDRAMLVTVKQRGRLTAEGRMIAGGDLRDFPLYRRALRVRSTGSSRTVLAASRRDEVIALAGPAVDQPTSLPQATTPQGPSPVAPGQAKTRPAGAYQPVTFRCDSFSSEVREFPGRRPPARRFTVARGHVYLSRGNPDGDLFLELTSQAAVIISEKRPPKEARVPWAEKIGGLKTDLPGPASMRETIVGVYLEGDVVIRRGERMMRGPVAYYDFTNDRALVIDPVFRTVQEQRNIPIYIRATEARSLSARELWFKNARISTSDFYSPTYHVGAATAYVMDTTPYDERQVRLAPPSLKATLRHATFNVRSIPLLYTPYTQLNLQEGHTALRKVAVGSHGQLGTGVETEWHLFRLLGLLRPKGFKGRVDLNWYERGPMAGVKLWYSRENYSGYAIAYGLIDRDREDDFGDDRENIPAPSNRGRILMRHKHLLPKDWQLQLELSYICDRNYLEQFHPNEFFAGKEQETLAYFRKQRDNWAVTMLLQYRMNRFLTQTESAPDLGFHLIGQPLLGDRLTFFHESRVGFKRYRPDKANKATLGPDSDIFLRLDTRNEIDWPFKLGAANLVAYATGRATYWDDNPSGGKNCRPYGQVGLRANTHIWRVYDGVDSRVWDLHGLKHVITPEVTGFITCDEVRLGEMYQMDPDIEQHLRRQSGVAIGVHQRLQTKRGPANDRRIVDWMRLDIVAGIYANDQDLLPADGRYFFYRPEYSLGRNHINVDYAWYVSDSTTFLADLNHDIDTGRLRRANVGLAVVRDPRLRYYLGLRYIRDLDSSIGLFGFSYRINRKYSVQFVEQYDFDFDGRRNMLTEFTITRKLPRWYAAFTFRYNTVDDNLTLALSLWPEGIPEARMQSGRLSLYESSDMN